MLWRRVPVDCGYRGGHLCLAPASCHPAAVPIGQMRIAMVGSFGLRPKATMSSRALPLARALAKRGHQVNLVLPPWSNPEDSGRTWQDSGVTVVNVPLPLPLPHPGHPGTVTWQLKLAGRLVQAVAALQPDVIHAFKPKAYAGLAAAWFYLTRFPCLVMDTDDWEGRGGWNERGEYSPAQRLVFAWQESWGLTHCHAVTVASRTLQALAEGLAVPPQHIFYLPNGTIPPSLSTQPAASFLRSQWGWQDRPVILLYTRFVEFQPQRAAQWFAALQRHNPSVAFLVVGQGLAGEEAHFRQAAARLGMAPESLHMAGWVASADLPDYFAAVDLAFVPVDDTLLNRAKCSAKLLDLMAAGVPAIVEAVGQYAIYVEHGSSGLLIPSGDVAAWLQAATALIEHPALRRSLGAAAQARVTRDFTWEKLAEVAEAAYRRSDRFS
ncbi:MAG: glycosyltransferase [Chloroflexi bacterium]|nr:glycosyltransferase [Chloroflexota bacterium]